jgi:type II secretion system protein L
VGIDRQRLAAWLDACGRAGLQPKAVHVDCLVRPVEARTIDVLVAADRTIVSAGALGGFAIDPGLAPALIGPWLKQSGLEGAALRVAGAEAGAFRAGAVQGALRIDAGEILARAACAPAASSPDVRQGAFAARDSAKPAWGAWRLAGILVVLAVMAQAATLGVQGWRDGEAARRTLAEAEREFRAVRPDVKRIVNLRAQVKALANAAAGVDRHPVLRASAPLTETLKAHPRVQLDELHYQGAGAQVVMRLSGPDAAALDAAAADLRGRGLGVVAGAAAAQSLTGGATLDLTVEAP